MLSGASGHFSHASSLRMEELSDYQRNVTEKVKIEMRIAKVLLMIKILL